MGGDMRLQVQGRVQTGVDRFDHGLGAATVWQDAPGGPVLVVSSGAQGGMSTWRIAPSGQVTLLAMTEYSTAGTRAARDHVELVPFRGEMLAFYGLGTTTFWGQVITPDGDFGATRLVGFDRAESEIQSGNTDFLPLWAGLRDDAPPGLPDLPAWAGTTGLARAGADLLVTGGTETGLRVLSAGAPPQLVGTELGIAAPTGLTVFGSGAQTRIVVAGAGGSSLSVLRMGPDGYVAAEHLIDTGQTAFAQVQALAGVTVPTPNQPLDLVLAGGGDHGVTLFALTPQGRLIWLDTLFDTNRTGLHNIATLTATLAEDTVVITATSQRDAGLTVLTLPLDGFGGLAPDGQGSAADDILIASPTVTTLTGGAGADVFVLCAGVDAAITDFTPGHDRLDLRDWPMLRDPAQLDLTPTATGARISYRDQAVTLTSAARSPLELADLFPDGLGGADRMTGSVALFDATPPPRVAVLRVATPGGVALGRVQVELSLADGGRSLHLTNDGVLTLPVDPPVLRLDATRPYDLQAGDPVPDRDDALDILRLALGLAPGFGPVAPQHFVAADIDRDGAVSAADALALLRHAMGDTNGPSPQWLFFDATTDWGALNLSPQNAFVPTGLAMPSGWNGEDLAMTGLLLGALSGQT